MKIAMRRLAIGLLLLALGAVVVAGRNDSAPISATADGRREVVFWHFWGGRHRAVVDEIVAEFNRSQSRHRVRAMALPGSNLDLKFFLAVTGGDPPDLLNQDDPIVGDWAHRGALMPLDALTTPEEYAELKRWLFPAALQLGQYNDRLYALCNGLDIRALYYDRAVLEQHGLSPPQTLADLDRIALAIAPPDAPGLPQRFGYLPDPRRLWAWGIVFGGEFYDETTGRVTADDARIVALDRMSSYARRYGPDRVAAFRQGDQALTGAAFPLFAGRYAVVMDGQWRVAEIAAVEAAAPRSGQRISEFGVVPLPPPPGGRKRAGWVNGNFFLVPRGSKNPEGAWAFMKFWSGFGGHEATAAEACAAGGWIPASQAVVDEPRFQEYLAEYPLFRTFVDLAGSPHQRPTPATPASALFYQEIVAAAEDALYRGREPQQTLRAATNRVQARLDALRRPALAPGWTRIFCGLFDERDPPYNYRFVQFAARWIEHDVNVGTLNE